MPMTVFLNGYARKLFRKWGFTPRIGQVGLGAQRQNLTAANSRIQDVDVATDVANMIRLQVLQQAAAAALSHANLQPQLVKSLLQQV